MHHWGRVTAAPFCLCCDCTRKRRQSVHPSTFFYLKPTDAQAAQMADAYTSRVIAR